MHRSINSLDYSAVIKKSAKLPKRPARSRRGQITIVDVARVAGSSPNFAAPRAISETKSLPGANGACPR